jgi:hypothetical protein
MHRSVRRGPLLSSIAACAILAGPVAGAQASDSTIRGTIDAYNGRIANDEARILETAATYDKTRDATPLINALHHEVRDLRALRGKLARESGSSARGRRGRADVVKGLGLIATGYSALAKDVSAASASKPVTNGELEAARAADRKGHNLVITGLKLLGT